jgi:hypothetical protein
LYGIAAECAAKAMLVDIGIRRDDLLFSHFPELRTLIRDVLSGRRASHLAALINEDSFMNNWHVRMRYTNGKHLHDALIDSWKDQAHRIVNTMSTVA